jgi:DNA-binding response OmpR family regulator
MVERQQRPARIVVAEDDADMRGLLAEALRKDGHDVIEAADGQRLLVAVVSAGFRETTRPVDLVVSDIRMPLGSGLDILQALRAARWTNPVILMTAFGDDETRARAEALGARLVDKPFELRALRAAVRELLPRGSGQDDP